MAYHPGVNMPTGQEPDQVDVEAFYVRTEELIPCAKPKTDAASIPSLLESESWISVCHALLLARRLAAHHPEELSRTLEQILPSLNLHMNSLRSSLCKTALICTADFFRSYGDSLLAIAPGGLPVLVNTLLSKAALEKKFVIEEAKRTLAAMTTSISTNILIDVLLPQARSPNSKIRAVVASCMADTVGKAISETRPGTESCIHITRAELLRTAAALVTDKEPAARKSARVVLCKLKESHVSSASLESWQTFIVTILGKGLVLQIGRAL